MQIDLSIGLDEMDAEENARRERAQAHIMTLPDETRPAAVEEEKARIQDFVDRRSAYQISEAAARPPLTNGPGLQSFHCDGAGCTASPFTESFDLLSHYLRYAMIANRFYQEC